MTVATAGGVGFGSTAGAGDGVGFGAGLASAIGALVMSYAKASIDRELGHDRHYLFYATYLLCLTGLLGVTITGDAFTM